MPDNSKVQIDILINASQGSKTVGDLRANLEKLKTAQQNVDKTTKTGQQDFDKLSKAIDNNNKKTVEMIVEQAKAAKNVRELRSAMKELTFAQEEVDKNSPDFAELGEAINHVEGRLGDLGDSIKTLSGSGVERLTGSTNLLAEGFQNLDLDKIKIALQGMKQLPGALSKEFDGLTKTIKKLNFKSLGSSMKTLGESGVGQLTKSIVQMGKAILTNPVLLLAGVLITLIAVCVRFYDKIIPIRMAFDAVGKAVDVVVQALKDFSDMLGLTNFADEKAAEQSLSNWEARKNKLTETYDAEIAKANAAGKNTFLLEKQKLNATQQAVTGQINALNKLKIANGKLTADQIKQLKELKAEWRSLTNEEAVLDIKNAKDTADKKAEIAKKAADAAKAAAKKLADDKKALDAKIATIADENKKTEIANIKDDYDRSIAYAKYDFDKKKELNEKDLAEAKRLNASKQQLKVLEVKNQNDLDAKAKAYAKALSDAKIAEAQKDLDQSKRVLQDKKVNFEKHITEEISLRKKSEKDEDDYTSYRRLGLSEYNKYRAVINKDYLNQSKDILNKEKDLEVTKFQESAEYEKMTESEKTKALLDINTKYAKAHAELQQQLDADVEKEFNDRVAVETKYLDERLEVNKLSGKKWLEISTEQINTDFDRRVSKAKDLYDQGLISKEQYDAKLKYLEEKRVAQTKDATNTSVRYEKDADDREYKYKLSKLKLERDAELEHYELIIDNVDSTQSEKEKAEDNMFRIKKKYAKLEEDLMTETAKKTKEQILNSMSAGLSAVNGLVGEAAALNQQQEATTLANTKLTGKALDKLKHDQFKKDQAYAKAQVIMNTAIGITTAMTQDPPLDIILAGVAVATGAAQLATIANTNYVSDTSSTPTAPSAPSSGSTTTSLSTPQFYSLGTNNPQAPVQKVVVVETDITKTQQTVSNIQAVATQTLGKP